MSVQAICWDWNGTLLDDVARCLRIMNEVLRSFGKSVIPDEQRYREAFRFPIEQFYADVGITADEYHLAVDRYLGLLRRDDTTMQLHDGARDVVEQLRIRGIHQVLASASEVGLLAEQLRPHGIADRFDYVLGTDDARAPSKNRIIRSWLDGTGLSPREVLLVGDTNHDQEIAEELGTRFVHFTRGHQELSGRPDVPHITALGQLTAHLG